MVMTILRDLLDHMAAICPPIRKNEIGATNPIVVTMSFGSFLYTVTHLTYFP